MEIEKVIFANKFMKYINNRFVNIFNLNLIPIFLDQNYKNVKMKNHLATSFASNYCIY